MEQNTQTLINLYLNEKRDLLDRFPISEVQLLVETIWTAYLNGNTVYACGNGGNAAFVANLITDISMHPFVSDDKNVAISGDLPRLKAVSLTDSCSTITAILNDIGKNYIFSQQLINNSIKKGDVVIGFSGSGNSENVLEAFKVANAVEANTVAITRGNGGKSKELANLCIIITGDSKFPGQIAGNNFNFHFEDSLSSISHMVTGIIKQRVQESQS